MVLTANGSDAVGNGRPDPGGDFLKQQFSGLWGHVNNLLGNDGFVEKPPAVVERAGALRTSWQTKNWQLRDPQVIIPVNVGILEAGRGSCRLAEISLQRRADPKLALDFGRLLGWYADNKFCREKEFCDRFGHLGADWTFRPSAALECGAESTPAAIGASVVHRI